MDSANTNGIDNSLASKVDIPTSCEQTILTKMEIVDAQPDVHLENANSQHIVEYINIHRVTDLAKNLIGDSIPAELLSHTVVDLASNPEYSQHLVANAQFYENADFLSQSFSDEDRRPNIVALGVQLIQSDRDGAADEAALAGGMVANKTPLPSVSTIPSDKAVISSIVPTYVQAVDPTVLRSSNTIDMHITSSHAQIADHQRLTKESVADHDEQIIKLYQPLLHDKLPSLPPLKKINVSNTPLSTRSSKYLASDDSNCNTPTLLTNSNLNPIRPTRHQTSKPLEDVKTERVSADLTSNLGESLPNEVYESDCDNENRSSQKSLPHKKRIPSKLKRASNVTSTRSIPSKCYKCNKCGEQFPTQAALNVHKQQQHSSKKVVFACELCNKTCPNQLKFFEHLKSHYEPVALDESQKCESNQNSEQEFELTPEIECSDTNETEIQLIENEDHPPYSVEQHKTLTCGKCNRVFRRQKAFDCHMSISHPKQEDIEEFSEPEDMMEGIRHVVNMVPTGDDEDKTYEPWQSPSSIENIVLPPQPVSQNETPSSTTTHTGDMKVTASPKSTKVEVKKEISAYPDDEIQPVKPRKEMPCPHCDRTFVHRNSLLYHIRSHTGHRPHQCELCGKSFFAAGALKIHLRLHSGDKPYKCEFCGRFFRQWGDLKYHITSLHSDKKMFQCEYCGKDFARKYSLVVHRRIHTGEKNYICEYCTKTFRAASYLQNHRRIHTGEKPHMCHVCGKPFRVRSDMKRHMKTHPDVNIGVLSELPKNSAENSSGSLVGGQEMVTAKQANISAITISDHDSEHNIKPVLPEAAGQLEISGRPETSQSEIFTYQRETIDDDRENTNAGTLYVWIQSTTDSILPDT